MAKPKRPKVTDPVDVDQKIIHCDWKRRPINSASKQLQTHRERKHVKTTNVIVYLTQPISRRPEREAEKLYCNSCKEEI